MGERNADNADLAVEELKKKAHRRLVGAIVLALAAAVILPLLLEKEPKPLGDDVSVQIPPVDEGKFINRLTGRGSDTKASSKSVTKAEPKPEPKTEPKAAEPKSDATVSGTTTPPIAAAPEAGSTTTAPDANVAAPAPANVAPAKKSLSQAEQRVLSPATSAAKVDVASASGSPPKPEPAAPASVSPSPTMAAAQPAAPPAASVPAPAPRSEPAVASAAKGEGFAVQIAAFTDDKGASALAAKLKKAGFASTYVEPVQTSRGTLWRVRVGGYAARADAEAARVKLRADGWNGIVVMAK
jgi:DedD protein